MRRNQMGSRATAWILRAPWWSSGGGRRPLFVTACGELSHGLKKKWVVVPARGWDSSPHKLVMTMKLGMVRIDTTNEAVFSACAERSPIP